MAVAIQRESLSARQDQYATCRFELCNSYLHVKGDGKSPRGIFLITDNVIVVSSVGCTMSIPLLEYGIHYSFKGKSLFHMLEQLFGK